MTEAEKNAILVHIEYIRKDVGDIKDRLEREDSKCNRRHDECDQRINAIASDVATGKSWFKAAGGVISLIIAGIIAYLVKVR